MKKFYFSLITMLLFVCMGAKAQEGNVIFNIEDPAQLKIYASYYDDPNAEIELVAGDNYYQVDDYCEFYLVAADGLIFSEITAESEFNGTIEGGGSYGGASTKFLYYNAESYGKTTYVIRLGDLESMRTATALVNVDNADMVELKLEFGIYPLVNGVNEVKFAPEVESDWTFQNPDGKPFYSITLNGEPVEKPEYYDAYYINGVKDGDVFIIQATFPEGEGKISLNFADDFTEKTAINYMTVNGEPYTYEGPFSLPYGDRFALTFNINECQITKLAVNGEDQDLTYLYSFSINPVLGDYDIEIAAEPFEDVTFTLDVDDASAVQAYVWTSDQEIYELEDGANEITLSRGISYFYVRPANAFVEFTEATLDGEELMINGSYGCTIETDQIKDGSVIKIRTAVKEYEYNVMVFHSEGDWSGGSLQSTDYVYYLTIIDYGHVPAAYVPLGWDGEHKWDLRVATMEYEIPYAYLNNIQLESESNYSMSVYGMEINDGDVIKLYTYEPTMCKVDVVNEDGMELSVITDQFKEQVNQDADTTLAVNFLALTETEVNIEVDGPATFTVNGEATESEDGSFAFVVGTEDAEIVITKIAGISNVAVDNANSNVVYNMQGIAVMRDANVSDIQTLRPGVYMLNGKKYIVR